MCSFQPTNLIFVTRKHNCDSEEQTRRQYTECAHEMNIILQEHCKITKSLSNENYMHLSNLCHQVYNSCQLSFQIFSPEAVKMASQVKNSVVHLPYSPWFLILGGSCATICCHFAGTCWEVRRCSGCVIFELLNKVWTEIEQRHGVYRVPSFNISKV